VPQTVQISREAFAAMRSHAMREPRQEICGLMAGRGGVITAIFPATNVAENAATSYEIAPREIFRMMREMRAAGLELLGIYHSHPTGDNAPSPRDIAQAFYPDAAYFILSARPEAANPVRAFSIRDAAAIELSIEISRR